MKRISPATVTFGVMAIVLGLVAAYIVRQALHQPPVVQAPAPPPPAPAPPPPPDLGVPVVTARFNLPKNYRISSEDLIMGYATRGSRASQGSMTYLPTVVGRIITQPLKAGMVLREEYLLPIGESLPDLAERLPAGTRALMIDVEGAATGGARLGEGDLVDIALTVEGTHPDLGELTTKTLLRSVLVVDSVADVPQQRGVSRAIRDRSQLTVAVTPADANKLIVAERSGTLSVSLVSKADTTPPAADDSINRRTLLGLKEIAPPPPPAPAKRFVIERWRGGNMSTIEMSDDRVRESRDFSAIPAAPPAAVPTAAESGKTTYIPSGVVNPIAGN